MQAVDGVDETDAVGAAASRREREVVQSGSGAAARRVVVEDVDPVDRDGIARPSSSARGHARCLRSVEKSQVPPVVAPIQYSTPTSSSPFGRLMPLTSAVHARRVFGSSVKAPGSSCPRATTRLAGLDVDEPGPDAVDVVARLVDERQATRAQANQLLDLDARLRRDAGQVDAEGARERADVALAHDHVRPDPAVRADRIRRDRHGVVLARVAAVAVVGGRGARRVDLHRHAGTAG